MSEVEERLRDALPRLGGVRAVVCFDLGQDGRWIIDPQGGTVHQDNDDPGETAPACVIKLSRDNLVKLMEGRLDPMLGYTLGKIRVSGSMGVAMKLVDAMG